MKPQEIFDTVVRSMAEQGRPAISERGGCSFRTEDGMECAVGCLIPDDMYHHDMESAGSVSGLMERYEVPDFFRSNEVLLLNLQHVHDTWAKDGLTKSQYATQLRSIAHEHELNAVVVDECFPGAKS